MYTRLFNTTVISSLLLLCSQLFAANWSTTKVELLTGNSYQAPFAGPSGEHIEVTKQVITLSHVSGNKYGSNFFFFDIDQEENDALNIYGEWSPSVSLNNFGVPKLGILKSTDLTGTLEFPSTGFVKLYGLSLGLDIPGFKVFSLNPLVRDNPKLKGLSFQLTTVWAMPLEFSKTKINIDGFCDYALSEGDADTKRGEAVANVHVQAGFYLDVGNYLGHPDYFQVGLEHRYWKNKFGIDGLDENVPQLSIRSVF